MALSANTKLQRRNADAKFVRSCVVATGAVIYQDALVAVTATGLLRPCANSPTLKFVGIAADTEGQGSSFPVTGVAAGTVRVTVEDSLEVLLPLLTAITASSQLTANIYAIDDERGTTSNTLGPVIGPMTEFVATNSGWIRLRGTLGTVAS